MLRSGSTYASSPAHPPTCAFRREAHRVPVTASRPSKWHPSRSTLGENDTPFASRVDANKERSPPHATVAVFLVFLSAARRKKSFFFFSLSEYAFAFPRGAMFASRAMFASSPTARTSTTWSCATCSSTFPSPPYVPGASRSALGSRARRDAARLAARPRGTPRTRSAGSGTDARVFRTRVLNGRARRAARRVCRSTETPSTLRKTSRRRYSARRSRRNTETRNRASRSAGNRRSSRSSERS